MYTLDVPELRAERTGDIVARLQTLFVTSLGPRTFPCEGPGKCTRPLPGNRQDFGRSHRRHHGIAALLGIDACQDQDQPLADCRPLPMNSARPQLRSYKRSSHGS